METLPEIEYQTTFKYLTLLKPMTLVEMSNESTNILKTSLTGSNEPLRGRNGSTMDFVLAIAKHGQDHVLWSSSPQSPGRVVHGDIKASNGILHIIDKAITPPMPAEWVLQNTPDLSEFYKVSRNLNLTSESFNGKTLFAVSNSAMLQFPSEAWSSPQQALAIQSHMIAGTYYSNNLTTSQINDPNTKASLSVTKLTDNDININEAKVLVKDILTANGPMHIVDKLMFRRQEDKPSDESSKQHLVNVASTQTSAATSPHDLQYHGHVITPVMLCIALIVGFIMLA
ncbi:hypothetical protein K450DRAFT_229284 [Umbelopsis ramanniana AG]|uniref:FAS1 domain-containing protein n=1 Tax=Umbelopsis ramanniana AG TaxID=1314678 RepID=A0AAD5EEW9_UMBRA|nr:uncharacterized protein K450DRAFT_229284 [Umbelopsis ramanniana AG]KAI8582157.1 hypothetical protein K450DRAFT_229284 [Umbelopsis ramanniana AG]